MERLAQRFARLRRIFTAVSPVPTSMTGALSSMRSMAPGTQGSAMNRADAQPEELSRPGRTGAG